MRRDNINSTNGPFWVRDLTYALSGQRPNRCTLMVKAVARCSTISGQSQVEVYVAACPVLLQGLLLQACPMIGEKKAEELRNRAVPQRSNSAAKSLHAPPCCSSFTNSTRAEVIPR